MFANCITIRILTFKKELPIEEEMCTDVQAITSASLREVCSVVQDSVHAVRGLLGAVVSLSCQTSLRLQWFKTNTM